MAIKIAIWTLFYTMDNAHKLKYFSTIINYFLNFILMENTIGFTIQVRWTNILKKPYLR